jgi:hypothetical protein
MMAGMANATGLIVHLGVGGSTGIGYDHTGGVGHELTTSSRVQLISGGITPPNPTNFTLNQVGSFLVGEGAGNVAGKFDKNYLDKAGAHFIRIWENNEPGTGRFYHSIYTPGSAATDIFPIDYYLASFNTRFYTGPPLAPTVSASIQYLPDLSGNLKPKLTITITHHSAPTPPTATDYETEISNYKIQIFKGTPAVWSDVDTTTCKNYTISPDGSYNGSKTVGYNTSDDPAGFYTMGAHYEIRVRGNNFFDHSTPAADWGYASADTISIGGVGYVYNVRLGLWISGTEKNLGWDASTGVSSFDVYAASASPEESSSYGSTPVYSRVTTRTKTVSTTDFGALKYYRVVPAGEILSTYPREVAGIKKIDLVKGINSFPFPFLRATIGNPLSSYRDLRTIYDLKEGINICLGNYVTAIGWYDKAAARSKGYIFTYWPSPATVPVGGAPADPASVSLVMDENYQVNVGAPGYVYVWGVR